jgi:DNA-binding GntR family transcriptional regulator
MPHSRPRSGPRGVETEARVQAWSDGPAPQIERSVLSAQVSKVIVKGLLSGRFRPGDRLVENDLAVLLGVSRSPIREALTELGQSGVVEREPGRGCRIRQWSQSDLEELFSVRALLEGYAARLACERFGNKERKAFERILKHMGRAGERSDYARMIDLDLEFHLALWRCAGNHLLLQVLESLSQQFRLFLTLNWKFHGGLEQVARNHRHVVEAIASGDPSRADAALHAHVRVEPMIAALQRHGATAPEGREGNRPSRPPPP